MTADTDARDERDTDAAVSTPAWGDDPRVRTAVEALLDGFLIYSSVRDGAGEIVDFRCEYANAATVANGGVPAEEQMGRTMLELFPRLEEEGYFRQYVQVVETGEPLVLVIPWYEDERIAGSFEVRAARVDDGCVIVFRDVTEAREREAALEATEVRLETFLHALPAGVAVIDWTGPAFFNAMAEGILGQGLIREFGPGELPELYHVHREGSEEPYPSEELPLRRALLEGLTLGARDIVVRRPERDVPLDTFATPIRSPEGDIIAAITVFTDATERRAQEARLAQAYADLERANADLGDFASHAAHDLAEPLRAVAGFAELLRRRSTEGLGDEAAAWIDLMLEGTTRMRTLIDELLTYAQAGSVLFEPASVDLGVLVAEARDGLATTFEAGATVEIGDLPVVNAHAEQIARVVQNLLSNAVKFASPGVPPHVVVDAERHGDEWHVRCADNGVGVPVGEAERVFEPFYRLSSGASGVGLGLAICRKVIERHGGRVWVEPAPGGGSRFTFTLPAGS